MKNVFFFLSVLFVFNACQNIEQYKPGIEDLSAKWDSTGTIVNNFAATLNNEIAGQTKMVSSMELPETVLTSLSDEAKTQVNEAKMACAKIGNDFSGIQQEVNTFKAEWETKGAELTALKDGLAAGKLEGDVVGKIAELNTFIADAGTKLAAWNTNLETAKAAFVSSHGNYTTVLASVMPTEEVKKK
ncbi:MAG: hypothetical protein R2788_11945 [Saprospiraceae bacterium]